MTFKSKLLTGAGLLVLSTGFAFAAPAVVQESVNLRAGPGVEYPIITAMPEGAPIDVMGCEGTWCRVAFGRTVGFASREFLALGGRIGPGYATYGEGYGNGYVPGETYSEGVTTGYSSGYGGTGFGADVRTREGVSAGTDIRTREGVRTGAGVRTREGVRTGANVRTDRRGERVGARTSNESRTSNTQTRTVLKGNNPMKDYGTTHNPNLRAEGQATPLKGNNPMRVRASTSNPNLRSTEAPAAIKGNNPMKMPARSAATNSSRPSETTGAAPRERERRQP